MLDVFDQGPEPATQLCQLISAFSLRQSHRKLLSCLNILYLFQTSNWSQFTEIKSIFTHFQSNLSIMETVVLKEIIGQWTRRSERKLSFYKCIFLLLMMILFICSSGEHRLFPRAAALGPGEGGYPPGVDMAQPLLSSTGGQCHRKAE